MYEAFKPTEVSVSADYILEILRDEYRQLDHLDCTERCDVSLMPTTTIAEWRETLNLLPWRELGNAYNREWRLAVSEEEWFAVLEPAKHRTLAGLCELLARYAKIPIIRPVVVLGAPCLAAGAFFTIRSMLGDAGVNTTQIRPSTSLAPFTRDYLDVFLGQVSRLAPGALRPVIVRSPVQAIGNWGCAMSGLTQLVGLCLQSLSLWSAGIILAVVVVLMDRIQIRKRSKSAQFGGLKTFRDLGRHIAERGWQGKESKVNQR